MNTSLKMRRASVVTARVALFVIYFWFGLLKVIGQSPASPLVQHLFDKTIAMILPFLSAGTFVIIFGLFEMLIGILFLIPGLERTAIVLFFIHIFTTALPLVLLPEVWTHPFVPTLEGQYIIKNLALVACVLCIWSTLPPKQLTKI